MGLVYSKRLPPFDNPFFSPLKLVTISISASVPALVLFKFIPENYVELTMLLISALNIMEAVYSDWKVRNILNSLSGLVLVLLIPFCFRVGWHDNTYYLLPHSLAFWILAYTLWNWNFVVFNFAATTSLYYVSVLLAPLIIIIFASNTGLWLVARITTLMIAALVHSTVAKQFILPRFNLSFYDRICTSLKQDKRLQVLFAAITIGIGLLSNFR
jgi:hypothetical protein